MQIWETELNGTPKGTNIGSIFQMSVKVKGGYRHPQVYTFVAAPGHTHLLVKTLKHSEHGPHPSTEQAYFMAREGGVWRRMNAGCLRLGRSAGDGRVHRICSRAGFRGSFGHLPRTVALRFYLWDQAMPYGR
jgi:hypothetical protein